MTGSVALETSLTFAHTQPATEVNFSSYVITPLASAICVPIPIHRMKPVAMAAPHNAPCNQNMLTLQWNKGTSF